MRIWVNFKELRAKLNFEDVLRHYGVELQPKGKQHVAFCCMPGHQRKQPSPQLSVNIERGIFRCFGCGAQGNVLEFAALMSGVNQFDGDALRAVAVELQQKFFPNGTGERKKMVSKDAAPNPGEPPVRVNVPLDFELKDLDAGHPYLSSRGFTRETAHHFGIGFCSRGLLQNRLAIPLHDSEGKLLGYCGRVVDESVVATDNPRYRFPSRRERGGIIYEFQKGLVLYNGFRIRAPCDDLVIVENFSSVWRLTQHGIPWAVALMGSECSDVQAELIVDLVKPMGRVWLLPNGDKAGERLAESFLPQVAQHRFVRWLKLNEGERPTDLVKDELKSLFTS